MAKDTPAPAGPTEESRLIAAISYVLGVVVAVLVFLLRKDDRFTKFHSAQAIMFDLAIMLFSGVVGVALIALLFVFGLATMGIGFFLGFGVVWLLFFAMGGLILLARLFLAYKAFTGGMLKLPLLGDHAEKIANG